MKTVMHFLKFFNICNIINIFKEKSDTKYLNSLWTHIQKKKKNTQIYLLNPDLKNKKPYSKHYSDILVLKSVFSIL